MKNIYSLGLIRLFIRSSHMSKGLLLRVYNYFARLRTRTLIIIPLSVGIICLIVQTFIWPQYTGAPLQNVLIPIGFLLMGLSGLPMILRREADFSLFILEGPLAVILGIILLAAGLYLGLAPLWNNMVR
jgi:hypothetical protein